MSAEWRFDFTVGILRIENFATMGVICQTTTINSR
jgi:hypothetical protein